MDNNSEVNVAGWVSHRLAELNPDGEWQPDVARALSLFKEQRVRADMRTKKLAWAAAAFVAACTFPLAFPKPRVLAQRCVAACQNLFADSPKVVSLSGTARDFRLHDATGADIRLSAYRGKVVLLNFWATWCLPCKTEIPWFVEFEQTYSNRGFSVIGVSMDEDGWKSVTPFMDAQQMNYPVGLGDEDLAKLYGVNSLPMTLLIDREGKVAAKRVGIVSKSDYENEIIRLLGK
jgi:peroxiredoxin